MPQDEIEPEITFHKYKTSPITVEKKIVAKKDDIKREALATKELTEFSQTVYRKLAEWMDFLVYLELEEVFMKSKKLKF